MKTKRLLMGLAAILILVFHFWMPLTASPIETNIYRSAYLGVDIFFFVSAYSLSQRKHISWLKFMGNRLLYVYAPFVVMCLMAALYKGWTLRKLSMALCGVSFFLAGGGSFLWFAIAIMLVYMVAPGMIKLKEKFGYGAAVIVMIAWLVLVCILQFVFSYTTIFILINRIPIMIIGFFYDDLRKILNRRYAIAGIIIGLVVGACIVYNYCGNVRLNKPISDIYYILVIPFTVSLIMLIDFIETKFPFKCRPLDFIGGLTLEIYGMQMIFGYDIESKVFKMLKQTTMSLSILKLISFLVTVCLLIMISWIFSKIKTVILEYVKRKKEEKV